MSESGDVRDAGPGSTSGLLVLGTLNEALLGLSDLGTLPAFWLEVCQRSRWIVPSRRLCAAILEEKDGSLVVVARRSGGQSQLDPGSRLENAGDSIGRIIAAQRPAWVGGPWDAARGVDAARAWLLDGDPQQVLYVPMHSRRKVLGGLFFATSVASEADRKTILASATTYALFVGTSYAMLTATLELGAASERLEEQNAELEKTHAELVHKLALNQAQHEAILTMSAPILQVGDRVLALPVLGPVDNARAARLSQALLEAVTRERAVVTIVDLTGVQVDGSSTVANLIDMMKAARLLGSRCVLSGVSHSLARDLVEIDLDVLAIPVFATLRRALEYAMAQTLTRS